MNIFTHDQCGGTVDINRKPVTCQKYGKVGHALITKDDGQNINRKNIGKNSSVRLEPSLTVQDHTLYRNDIQTFGSKSNLNLKCITFRTFERKAISNNICDEEVTMPKSNPVILITGVTGNISKELIKTLSAQQIPFRGMVRSIRGLEVLYSS